MVLHYTTLAHTLFYPHTSTQKLIHQYSLLENACYCRDERQKATLKRRIQMKQTRLNSLENQHDQLYDAWERESKADVQNSIQLSQKYQHMTDGAIRQVESYT